MKAAHKRVRPKRLVMSAWALGLALEDNLPYIWGCRLGLRSRLFCCTLCGVGNLLV